MAKKRKAGGGSTKKETVRNENTRFAPNERFAGSEDEFEVGRDRVLLEERPEVKRRRKLEEEEEFLQPSDEEIHAYNSDSEDDDEFEDNIYDEEDSDTNAVAPKVSSKSRRREQLSPDSLGDGDAAADEEEETGGWGSSKKDYYDADVIETEGDALEEEEEAKRMQQNKLQSMADEDFGFDETEWLNLSQKKEKDGSNTRGKKVITEILPELQVPDDMSAEDKLKILKRRYPEFEPLSKDFADLQPLYQELSADVKSFSNHKSDNEDQTPISAIKLRILSTYLGVISMYFVLLTSPAHGSDNNQSLAMSPAELREHPIMEALVTVRKQWEQIKNLKDAELEPSPSISASDSEEGEEAAAKVIPLPKKLDKKKPITATKKTKAQKAAEAAHALAKTKRAEKLNQTELGLNELSKLLESNGTEKQPTSRRKESRRHDDDSDFGDEIDLTAHEAAEKAKKKKSLRFYTSQLAQKANKRGAAGRDAGGDTDLPYRERIRDRQARLNVEAEKRGQREADERERLGGDSDEEDYKLSKDIRDGDKGSDSDDYYDMVVSRNKEKKENKKKLAEASAAAAREGGEVHVQEEVGPDGKRAITYAIEKNKGLAPKRNKDVRNPRVKKRKKYEEKKKKLGSMKQIYKGGEGRGGYSGEMTGIKKNLVKSVKL